MHLRFAIASPLGELCKCGHFSIVSPSMEKKEKKKDPPPAEKGLADRPMILQVRVRCLDFFQSISLVAGGTIAMVSLKKKYRKRGRR